MWDTFLQQQFHTLHPGIAVKAPNHDVVVEMVHQRDDNHPLVMGHILLHDCARLAQRQPAGGIVDGLVEAVGADGRGFLEPGYVLHDSLWCERQRDH